MLLRYRARLPAIGRALFATQTKPAATQKHAVTIDSINCNVKNASYAVRGPIVARAAELSQQLIKDKKSVPFSRIIPCNIGNPQALQQQPLTFVRDVVSIFVNPSLKDRVPNAFNSDVVKRAQQYIDSVPSAGAYTDSAGIRAVREEVADFLLQRDGHASDPDSIFLTSGASDSVRFCMQTILRTPESGFRDAILTPIPQYPLYSALTTLLQGNLAPYYLDESQGWACTVDNLTASLNAATEKGHVTKALVVINPGNPTGQVLSESNIRDIISWCREKGIMLLADEVYQENVYKEGARFVSFRKVAYDMKAFDGENSLQLASFHTISKGFLGECGFRGGYCELVGVPSEIKAQILKLSSINLCSNTVGQVMVGIMSNPPKRGDPSYEQYATERDNILSSLKRRSKKLVKALNGLKGMSCTDSDGAMYAFPQIMLPPKAVAKAKELGMAPDAMYCMQLLEQTGVVCVPGSGFGQADGTHHFRTTILPPEEMIDDVVRSITSFHEKFLADFA